MCPDTNFAPNLVHPAGSTDSTTEDTENSRDHSEKEREKHEKKPVPRSNFKNQKISFSCFFAHFVKFVSGTVQALFLFSVFLRIFYKFSGEIFGESGPTYDFTLRERSGCLSCHERS